MRGSTDLASRAISQAAPASQFSAETPTTSGRCARMRSTSHAGERRSTFRSSNATSTSSPKRSRSTETR
jgi:hypothetical protein